MTETAYCGPAPTPAALWFSWNLDPLLIAVYTPHTLTAAAWGLTPLQDQQLGGVVMWVPGCLVFLAVALIALRRPCASRKPRTTAAHRGRSRCRGHPRLSCPYPA